MQQLSLISDAQRAEQMELPTMPPVVKMEKLSRGDITGGSWYSYRVVCDGMAVAPDGWRLSFSDAIGAALSYAEDVAEDFGCEPELLCELIIGLQGR